MPNVKFPAKFYLRKVLIIFTINNTKALNDAGQEGKILGKDSHKAILASSSILQICTWVTCFKDSGFWKKIFVVLYDFIFLKELLRGVSKLFFGNLWSTSFKNSCERMRFLVKLQAPSRLFFNDLGVDFTATSLGRAISRKLTSLERIQQLVVPLLLFFIHFYFPTWHLPAQG